MPNRRVEQRAILMSRRTLMSPKGTKFAPSNCLPVLPGVTQQRRPAANLRLIADDPSGRELCNSGRISLRFSFGYGTPLMPLQILSRHFVPSMPPTEPGRLMAPPATHEVSAAAEMRKSRDLRRLWLPVVMTRCLLTIGLTFRTATSNELRSGNRSPQTGLDLNQTSLGLENFCTVV